MDVWNKVLMGAATAAVCLTATAAHARIDECGGAHVERGAECFLRVEASCEGSCDLDAALNACAADLQAACTGDCDFSAEVSCTGDCRAPCEAECSANPGAFDCSGACQLDCEGSCSARCSDAEDSAQCRATCEGNCSAECDASCEVQAPDADCVAQCEACCGGSCTAEVNLDCQVECQAEGFANCQESFAQNCATNCGAEGSLFCDGQYIDAGDDLDACIDALEERGIEVEQSFNIDGLLQGAGGGCSVGESGPGNRGVAIMTLLLGLGLLGTRRFRPASRE